MTDATRRKWPTRVIVPSLFIGGIISTLAGIASLAVGRVGVIAGILLVFGGAGAIVMTQLLELLMDIEEHLAAIRAQLGKGVLGLIG